MLESVLLNVEEQDPKICTKCLGRGRAISIQKCVVCLEKGGARRENCDFCYGVGSYDEDCGECDGCRGYGTTTGPIKK